MSERDDSRGGRFEPEFKVAQPGLGLRSLGRCDECQRESAERFATTVKAGPLRGVKGMVCRDCMSKRRRP